MISYNVHFNDAFIQLQMMHTLLQDEFVHLSQDPAFENIRYIHAVKQHRQYLAIHREHLSLFATIRCSRLEKAGGGGLLLKNKE